MKRTMRLQANPGTGFATTAGHIYEARLRLLGFMTLAAGVTVMLSTFAMSIIPVDPHTRARLALPALIGLVTGPTLMVAGLIIEYVDLDKLLERRLERRWNRVLRLVSEEHPVREPKHLTELDRTVRRWMRLPLRARRRELLIRSGATPRWRTLVTPRTADLEVLVALSPAPRPLRRYSAFGRHPR